MNLKALCWVKEARYKDYILLWFHLCETLEKAETIVTEQRSVISRGGRSGGRLTAKGNERTFGGDGNYVRTIGVIALLYPFFFNFKKYYFELTLDLTKKSCPNKYKEFPHPLHSLFPNV